MWKNLISKGRFVTVDASKISLETIGREIPNTPMMGALIRITGILDLKAVTEDIRHKLEMKFRNKPEVHRRKHQGS